MSKYAPKLKRDLKKLIDNTAVNLGDIDTKAITDMSELFLNSTRENFSGIETWNTRNVLSMRAMFYGATYFNVDIRKWDTSNVLDMQFMFKDATSFNQDISFWDVGKVMDMSGMFEGATSFNQNISVWKISSLKYKTDMFKGCNLPIECKVVTKDDIPKSKEELDYLVNQLEMSLKTIDTSYITDMSNLFLNTSRDDFSGIETWNTENVITMESMFRSAKNFNADISKWDTSRVQNMKRMFEGATSFNQDISAWNVGGVKIMKAMFKNATEFNKPLNKWNVSNVVDMSEMFKDAKNFNQNINKWNVVSVRDMYRMFEGAANFNQDISAWKLKNITLENYIFGKSNTQENKTNENQTSTKGFFGKIMDKILRRG